MILYYSATGNTRYAARLLAERLQTEAFNILDLPENLAEKLAGDDSVGLMFPIYCWGVPPVMRRFVDQLKGPLKSTVSDGAYLFAVCTCGDEAGTAMRSLDTLLQKEFGRRANALWSVIMPNTYVMLPGFDVDSPEVEAEKLSKAPGRLSEIASLVRERKDGVYDVVQGSMPRLRSALFPVFEKWGVNTKWWNVSDACIGCGKCAANCPAHNITLQDGRPVWGSNCFSCCACYHCCPVNAISYASFTKGKGQYHSVCENT